MQEKKITRAKIVLEKLREFYGFKTFGKLANFLGVKQNTLSSWISRDSLDEDLIFRKCEGISYDWIRTGEGEMLLPSVKDGLEAYTKDQSYSLSLTIADPVLVDIVRILQDDLPELKEKVLNILKARKELKDAVKALGPPPDICGWF